MFNLFKKSSKSELYSPVSGQAILISEISDPVFSDKVLGDGVALIPEEVSVYSPCNGTIVQIAHSLHAVCIESEDGAEVLLHLGIDTVKLDGDGFTCHVKTGDRVKAGQLLIDFDINEIKAKGFDIASPCIITNLSDVTDVEFLTGAVVHGETPIIKYKKK